MTEAKNYSLLCRMLGYEFKDIQRLEMALTHRSASSRNNERLEFLGDALLGYVIADTLFARFPQASEGQLTRLRSTLVKKETLAEIAQQLDLGQYLRLGGGELKSGGWRRASILADAVEALLGSIYLDSGMEECRRVLLTLWTPRLEQLDLESINKDPKTRLQEYLQARKKELPQYEVTSIEGEAHDQRFAVTCRVAGLDDVTYGEGRSRRHAEQAAAEQALRLLTQKLK